MNLFEFSIPDWIFVAINLLILVFALKKILWDKVGKILDARQAIVDKSIEAAAFVDSEKNELIRRRQDFEDQTERETVSRMQESRRLAGAEYDRIVNEAEEKARMIISNAHTQAEKLREAQINEAKSEIISSVLDLTGKLLDAKMDTQQNEQLIASFLQGKDEVR